MPDRKLDGRRVLVVEESAELRRWLVRVLRREAARVLVASTAEAAVRILVEMRVDVVVTHIGLPGMKGPALADVVRRLGGIIQDREGIRIVGISGDEIPQSDEARFDRFLQKPFRVRELIAVLHDMTGGRPAADRRRPR